MNQLPRIQQFHEGNETQEFFRALKRRDVEVKRRGTQVKITLPEKSEMRTEVLLLIGGSRQIVKRYNLQSDQILQLELHHTPDNQAPEPLEMENIDDPRHYIDAVCFSNLLDAMDYKHRIEKDQLTIELDPDASCDESYTLALLTANGWDNHLFNSEINGRNEENKPFSVILGISEHRSTPGLYKTVSSAEDYLVLAPDIERMAWDWQGDEELRTALKSYCEVCYDETGPGSQASLRQILLGMLVPELVTRYRRAVKTKNDEELNQLWQLVFDAQVNTAISSAEDYVIIHLRHEPSERYGIYLLEREVLPEALGLYLAGEEE